MKIVIPGGTGEVGNILARAFTSDGHDVIVLSRGRKPAPWRVEQWDGETIGDWANAIDGADAVINLAGRSVNCRYTDKNKREIMDSRLKSTRVIGEAIALAADPPKVWLQMSTATIYSHRFEAANDEMTGIIGGKESNAPESWKFSIDVANAWERAARDAQTPHTRKVLMRLSILMSPERRNTRSSDFAGALGLGGKAGSGRQYMSWLHDRDLVRSIYWLIEHDEISGPVNLAAPNPVTNSEFMQALRKAYGMPIGLPAFEWQLKIATFLMRTESELILKSRRVVPKVLTDSGFEFEFPGWNDAAGDLVERWKRI